ncbi:IPT/TIG domain-containing protein [Flagellimonas algicola]|uniref:IPT/TIG domain-containing protein n=1 Tax=Flagellimonas algicola TaxID=2583815 RepID=A0ABY2WGK0_9FLAO|nr:IPT/TIG domain-containing protein [Allomuricauda algicola]TMU50676.1 hypothetical protein FGG15_17905 [Allomuricauda algicola]
MITIRIFRARDIFLLLVLLSLALSCGSDDNGMDCPDPTNADCDQIGGDPTLSSVAPVTGPKHTEVVITGENFGTDATKVSVSFNGTPGEVLGVTDTEVTVRVPARAYTGPITMVVDGFDLTGPEFVYELTYTVETFAGGEEGYEEGSGTEAKFYRPNDLVMDSGGNIFVVDSANNAIRKIAPDGEVSTFAGGVLGSGEGQFGYPRGLAIDGDDNIYVADSGNHRIVKVDPSGDWTLIAGVEQGYVNALGTAAKFRFPAGILVGEDAGGSALYVSEDNHAIRRISLDDDQYLVGTYAGPTIANQPGERDGGLSGARFSDPRGMAKSGEGTILLADYGNHSIRAIDQSAGTVERFAGGDIGHLDGNRSEAKFRGPSDISMAGDGTVYIVDSENNCIRHIDSRGNVTTIAGVPGVKGYKNGTGDEAQFHWPTGVLYGREGEIYVADTFNNAIRKIIID